MARYELREDQWKKIEALLPSGKPGQRGGVTDNRSLIQGVIWIARSGAPWRDLPGRYGKWDSVYKRFNRWAKRGFWQAIFEQLQDPDLEWLLIDSSIVRAHQHSAGQKKSTGRTVKG